MHYKEPCFAGKNIGFGEDAYNGGRLSTPFSMQEAKEIDFPLSMPESDTINMDNDAEIIELRFRNGYPFWFAYLGNNYRRYYPSKNIKFIEYMKRIIKSKI